MHVVLLAMSLQPCAMSFAPQQTQKARSLVARFCALAKSEHPANVRKRLPRCRSFPCIDVFARQLSHPHLKPTARKLVVQPNTKHLSTQPDLHLSSHTSTPPIQRPPIHCIELLAEVTPRDTCCRMQPWRAASVLASMPKSIFHDGQAMKSWSSQPSC